MGYHPSICPLAARGYRNKYMIRADHKNRLSIQRGIFYKNRVMTHWNALDNEIIESSNLNIFKSRYDKL
jgi:hypothetical protein